MTDRPLRLCFAHIPGIIRYLDFTCTNGNCLSLRICGYQFPDADDPAQRFSWHMVNGSVTTAEGSWSFTWQALTCDESALISSWLRDVASTPEGSMMPSQLEFTEPNLSFAAVRSASGATVTVSFDSEFQPPWHARRGAGDPYRAEFPLTSDQLIAAADLWDDNIAVYPDGLSP